MARIRLCGLYPLCEGRHRWVNCRETRGAKREGPHCNRNGYDVMPKAITAVVFDNQVSPDRFTIFWIRLRVYGIKPMKPKKGKLEKKPFPLPGGHARQAAQTRFGH